MVSALNTELRTQIAGLLRNNPALSQRELIRQVRAAGFRGSNDKLRTLVTLERQGILTAEDFLNRRITPRQGLESLPPGTRRTLTERQSREAARLLGFDVDLISSYGQASHLAVSYSADITFTPYLYGQRQGTRSIVLTGTRILDFTRPYDADVARAIIQNQIVGRILRALAQEYGLIITSDPEGLDVEIERLQISLRNPQLRGQRGTVRGSQPPGRQGGRQLRLGIDV